MESDLPLEQPIAGAFEQQGARKMIEIIMDWKPDSVRAIEGGEANHD